MAKHLWATAEQTKYCKTYKTRSNAVKKAEEVLGDLDIRYLIVSTEDGRFMPVAIGEKAMQYGIHFHICVAG